MKITAIPQLYRNLKRWREILAVLRRYGLADWLSRFSRLPFRDRVTDLGGVPLTDYTREQRVRLALTELGPTFIKLGQILAGRPDLVGPVLGNELKGLRANVRPDKMETVEATLLEDLGEDYRDHFLTIDSKPLATASIGQVHRATLRDGRRVVIKVQRSGIEKTIRQDIDVLGGVAQLAERVDAFAAWGPADMVREMSVMLSRELDFSRERQNLDHFAELLAQHSSNVIVPAPIDHLCSRRVLVMEELVGRSLADVLADPDSASDSGQHVSPESRSPRPEDASQTQTNSPDSAKPTPGALSKRSPGQRAAEISTSDHAPETAAAGQSDRPEFAATKARLCETIAKAYLTMLFDAGLFHADPHPGNLILLDDGRLGILDFGMIGRLDETLRETIEEMLVAIASGDQNRLTRLIRRVGSCPPTLDESALAIDVAEFVGTYGKQSLGQFDLTGALNELSDVLHRHAIKLPNQSSLLLKMLISLEGTLRELGARFDSLDVVQTFVRKSMARRLSPTRRLRQARRIYLESENFLESAPDEVLTLLRQARRGEIKLSLDHQKLGPTVNRLVLGMITSAVFLGSSLMLAFKVAPVLFPDESYYGIRDLSILGLIGAVGSIVVMLWIMLAINRSGHLTRENDD